MENFFKKIIVFDGTDLKIWTVFMFFSVLSLNYIFLENNLIVFLIFFLFATIFIWNDQKVVFLAILLSVMIFGEKFSLLPIQIADQTLKIYLMDIFVAMIFLFWILQIPFLNIKIESSKKNKKDLWLMLFFIFLIFNLFRSFLGETDKILAIGSFKNYAYLLIYFFAIKRFSSWDDIYRVLKALFLGGVIIIGFVVFGFLAGQGLWTESTPGLRYISGLHAYFLTFPLIIVFTLGISSDYVKKNILIKSVFLMQCIGLIGSMFRHLWLGFLSAVFVIFVFLKKNEKINILKNIFKIFMIFVFVAFFLIWIVLISGNKVDYRESVFISSLVDRVKTLTQSGYEIESAAGWRLAVWQVALQEYAENPIMGIGLGQKIYLDYDNFLNLVDIRNIHNDILGILVQVGILGFLPFAIFHILICKDLLKVIKKSNKINTLIALIFAGFFVVAFFGAFFAIYISFTGTAIFYWLIMAIISIIYNLSLEK